ncbi:hypothetical protein BDP27DRAFT_1335258 [Rhodocollybia butyracea]|uniref:Fe2OG dioxygenase domain-containing protein n=1 Tax=Rhodocollybia butyracea TaxID=206335 RepID=A0A9P5PCV9_9AGAR|nr:hypothetical protein BDP27DRAFT_1335258 [Rhodocollybia butyracea]
MSVLKIAVRNTAIKPLVSYIDFTSTPLAKSYSGAYALIIDNLFSPEECKDLITLAESTESDGGKGWQPALLRNGSFEIENQVLNTSYRHNDRILRVLPFVKNDIGVIEKGSKWHRIVGDGSQGQGTWNLVGLNERLSFLRYGPGHFFKQHLDGRLELPDGRKSRVTIQVYLNGSDTDVVEGGATRFRAPRNLIKKGDMDWKTKFLDIEPRVGRALIFQQRSLVHRGERVTSGLKYALRTDFMFEQSI